MLLSIKRQVTALMVHHGSSTNTKEQIDNVGELASVPLIGGHYVTCPIWSSQSGFLTNDEFFTHFCSNLFGAADC